MSGEELLLSRQRGKFSAKVCGMSKLQLFLPPLSKQGNHGKFAALMCDLQGQHDPTCDKVHYCCFQELSGISELLGQPSSLIQQSYEHDCNGVDF